MKIFNSLDLKKLYIPDKNSSGEQNGQVTIIGGSSLFHGAPLLSLKVVSRIVDMVFFSSPEPYLKAVVSELKASLSSFIWVPFEEVEKYIEKSDAVLIGPGLMRYTHELGISNKELLVSQRDHEGEKTKAITKKLLIKYPHKKWVIDAGSLQVMDKSWIPPKSILTPNSKELEILFGIKNIEYGISNIAKEYNCIIVAKGPETVVSDGKDTVLIKGGNAGLTKGGTGDVLAGLTVALLAKNDPLLAACSASYIVKAAADDLYQKVGTNYNSDDLAGEIPLALRKLTK